MRALCLLFCCAACGGGAPSTARQVVSTAPASGATGVRPDATVSVVFGQEVLPESLTNEAFSVVSGAQAAAGTLSADGATVVFEPDADLAANTQYTVKVSLALLFADGQPLSEPFQFSFKTGAAIDRTPPQLVRTTPAADATGVSPATSISALFDGPLNPASVTQATFNVTTAAGAGVAGTAGASGSTATFTPAAPLTPSTVYTATLAATVKDTDNNELGAPLSWSFTIGGSASSLIDNGSFEADTASPPTGWAMLSTGAFAASATSAHAGTNAAKFTTLTSTTGGREVRSSCFPIAQRAVNVSGFLLTPEAAANTSASFKVFFFKDAGCATAAAAPSATETSSSLAASNAWTLRSYSATPGADATYAYVSLRAKYAAAGTSASLLWFDDLAVTQ